MLGIEQKADASPNATETKKQPTQHDLFTAVVDNNASIVNELLDLGVNPTELGLHHTSAAALALCLQQNNCYAVIANHPAFLSSFKYLRNIFYFFLVAMDARKWSELKDLINALDSKQDLPLDLKKYKQDFCDKPEFLKVMTKTNSEAFFTGLGFKVPAKSNASLPPLPPQKSVTNLPILPKEASLVLNKKLCATHHAEIYTGLWTGQPVAVKLIQNERSFNEEVEIHKNLQHPTVIHFFGTYINSTGFYIIMELATLGTLYDQIKKANYDEATATKWLKQVAAALEYLNMKQIMHCDIKAENVLMTAENNAKLADFGFSLFLLKKQHRSPHCTLAYVAPECTVSQFQLFDTAIDIYAFAFLIYETLTKTPSWYTPVLTVENRHQILFSAIHWGVRPQKGSLSDAQYALLQACWHSDPKQRPSAQEIRVKLG